MTGVGGGSLMTPLLLTVFKLNPAVAIGTDLWFAGVDFEQSLTDVRERRIFAQLGLRLEHEW